MRWFLNSNAASPLSFGGRTFKFDPVSVAAGRLSGVYQAQDAGEEAVLLAAASSRVGVSVLSDEDAAKCLAKKKTPTSRSFFSGSPRAVETPPALKVVDNGTAGSVASTVAPDAPVIPLKGLINVGKVNPPQPLVDPADRMSSNWTEPVIKKGNITIRHINPKPGNPQ